MIFGISPRPRVGWGGVVGEVRDKAISTQVVVEIEV